MKTMRITTKILMLTLTLLGGQILNAQHLRRSAMWGIRLAPIPEEVVEKLPESNKTGVYIQQVFPGATAEALKIASGDVIRSINGIKLNSTADLGNPSLKFRHGDKIEMVVFRNGKDVKLAGKAQGKPFETYENTDVHYGELPFMNGYLRTIATQPKGAKKAPVVFFVPGYTCASYDNLPPGHPYQQLIEGFVKLGYVVYRTEKPGMGDCDGTPSCLDIDFATEQSAFEAGYEAMLKLDYIDKDNIFILGHSMGGLQGPLLAQKYHPKGLFVYGTSHVSWYEYILEMLRFQNPRNGVDFKQHEDEMKLYTDMMYAHYVLKKTPKEIASSPEKVALLKRDFWWDGEESFFGRNYKFMQDLQDLQMGKIWADLDCHVLSMFGEADFEALSPFSHQEIVRIVNQYHPGYAEYQFLPGTDHGFRVVGTMDEGVKVSKGEAPPGKFNDEVVKIVHEWMQRVIRNG